MTKAEIVERTRAHLEEKFNAEGFDHDYWHMYRVWQLAKHIAKSEKGVDMFTLELTALLHDVADWKFHDGDEEAGPRAAREWLEGLDVGNEVIERVEDIIRNMSFKGAKVEVSLKTIEGQIVYDADKLDAIGAIGIARAFATGARFNEVFHDPNAPIPVYNSAQEYVAAKGKVGRTVVNHFYEKLLLLKDRMFTKTGKEMAQRRHKVMEEFLEEFLAEWEGSR